MKAQNLDINITGIRNSKGRILITVFKDNESFRAEKSCLDKSFAKTGIKNGEMTVQISLEPGTYGVSLLDDENSNDNMEYNFLGIPKEGFGFSDYYHTGLTKPKFDAFKFNMDLNQKRIITIRVKYM